MVKFASRLRRKADAGIAEVHQLIRNRVGFSAQSFPALAPRAIQIGGNGGVGVYDKYPTYATTGVSYSPGTVVEHAGKQWVLPATTGAIGPPAGPFNEDLWFELRPLSYACQTWSDLINNGSGAGGAKAALDMLRAANPAQKIYQYACVTVTWSPDIGAYGISDADDWLDANSGWLTRFSNTLSLISRSCTTQGNNVVLCPDTSGLVVGMGVSGSGIPTGASIGAITTNVSFTLVNIVSTEDAMNATNSTTATRTFDNRVTTDYVGNTVRINNLARMDPDGPEPIKDANGDTYADWFAKRRRPENYYNLTVDGYGFDVTWPGIGYTIAAGDLINFNYHGGDRMGTAYWRSSAAEASNEPTNVLPLIQNGQRAAFRAIQKHIPSGRVWVNYGYRLPDSWKGEVDCAFYEGWGRDYSPEQQQNNGWLQLLTEVERHQTEFMRIKSGAGSFLLCAGYSQYSNFGGVADIAAYPNGVNSVIGRHQDMRYWLSTVLLTDAIFAWLENRIGSDAGGAYYRCYMPEFDVPLGVPSEPTSLVAWSNGVYKREYTNGLVLVHPRLNLNGWAAEPARTVTLPFACRRLTGTKDPSDNGALLPAGSTVSLPCRSGLILLKA